MLKGKLVHLKPYTREGCHQLFKGYIADSQMTNDAFIYNPEKVDTTLRNIRSQHILMKLGFEHIKNDQNMSYYRLNNPGN